MKKYFKNILFEITIITLVVFLTGCSSGIVKNADIDIQNTGTHEKKDINRVINKLKNEFADFKHCELLNIKYDSKKQGIKEWDEKYYDIIFLEFDFKALKNTEVFLKDNVLRYKAVYGKKYESSSWKLIDMGQG